MACDLNKVREQLVAIIKDNAIAGIKPLELAKSVGMVNAAVSGAIVLRETGANQTEVKGKKRTGKAAEKEAIDNDMELTEDQAAEAKKRVDASKEPENTEKVLKTNTAEDLDQIETADLENKNAEFKARQEEAVTKGEALPDFEIGDDIAIFSMFDFELDGKTRHVTWNFSPQGNVDKSRPDEVVAEGTEVEVMLTGHHKDDKMEYYTVSVIIDGVTYDRQPADGRPLHITITAPIGDNGKPQPAKTGEDAQLRRDNGTVETVEGFTPSVVTGTAAVQMGKYSEMNLKFDKKKGYEPQGKQDEQTTDQSTEDTTESPATEETTGTVGIETDETGTDVQQDLRENSEKVKAKAEERTERIKAFRGTPEWRKLLTTMGNMLKEIVSSKLPGKGKYANTVKAYNKVLKKVETLQQDIEKMVMHGNYLAEQAQRTDLTRPETVKLRDNLEAASVTLDKLEEQLAAANKFVDALAKRIAAFEDIKALRKVKKATEVAIKTAEMAGSQLINKLRKSKTGAYVDQVFKIDENTEVRGILDLDMSLKEVFEENMQELFALIPPSMRDKLTAEDNGDAAAAFNNDLAVAWGLLKRSGIHDKQPGLVSFTGSAPAVRITPEIAVDENTGTKYIKFMDYTSQAGKAAGGIEVEYDPETHAINPVALLGELSGYNNETKPLSTQLTDAIKLEGLQVSAAMTKTAALKGSDLELFIREGYGIRPDSAIYADLAESILNGQVPEASFRQTAGKNILKSLNIKLAKDIDSQLEDQIIAALGLMAVEAARSSMQFKSEEAKYIGKDAQGVDIISNEKFPGSKGYRVTSVKFANDEDSARLIAAASALEYLSTDPRKIPVSLVPIADLVYGEATVRGKRTLMPKEVVDYINSQQNKPRYFTDEFKALYDMLNGDREAFYEALLASDEDIRVMPDAAKITALGNRKADKMVIDNMLHTYELIHNGKADEEVAFYLPWDYTVSGRYMIDNVLLNPQNSKISRFLTQMTGMKSKMRVEDGKLNEFDFALFRGGIAQALDMDIDKDSDANVFDKLAKNMIDIKDDGTFTFPDPATIKDADMRHHSVSLKRAIARLEKGEAPNLTMFPVNERMHVYQVVAALVAMKAAKGKSFDHNLVIEMDAITSGMILTLLQIGTTDAMKLLEKGGAYSKSGKVVSPYKNHGEYLGDGGYDMYRTPAESLRLLLEKAGDKKEAEAVALRVERQKKNSSIPDMTESELTASRMSNMEKLIDKFVIKGNDKKWRSLMKPLVMVYIYGASMSSIKKKAGFEIGVGTMIKALGSYKSKKVLYPSGYGPNNEMTFTTIPAGQSKTLQELLSVAFPNYNREIGGLWFVKDGKGKTLSKRSNIHTDPKLREETDKAKVMLSELLKGFSSGQPTDIFKDKNGDNKLPEVEELSALIDQMHYRKLDENGELITVGKQDYAAKTAENLKMSQPTIDFLADRASMTYGNLIEESFKEHFSFLDDFRTALKSVEIVNYALFKFKLGQELKKLSKGANNVKISKKQFTDIVTKLNEQGFGYVANDINGGLQDYTTTTDTNVGSTAVLGNMRDGKTGRDGITKTSPVYSAEMSTNVGATGVITIHNIDGFLMNLSNVADFQNIYDAYILGIREEDAINTSDSYNGGVIDTARTHNILEKAIDKSESNIASMLPEDKAEFIKFLADQAEVETLRDGMNRIDSELDVDHVGKTIKKTIDERPENLGQEWLISHLYVVDAIPGKVVPKAPVVQGRMKHTEILKMLRIIKGNIVDLAEANNEVTTITEQDVQQNLSAVADMLGTRKGAFNKVVDTFMKNCQG